MAPLEVTVQFDHDLPAMPVRLPEDGKATVRWVKEELCRQDPTGASTPDSFHLCAADSPSVGLADSSPITHSMETLILQARDPELEAKREREQKEREELEREELEFAMRLAREEAEHKAKLEREQAERQARREKAERLEKMVVEGGGPITDDGPHRYACAAGRLFLKKSSNPRSAKVVQQKRQAGSTVRATGKRWTGPSGGLWAELEPCGEVRDDGWDQAWALVEGPGFGLEGPALISLEGSDAVNATHNVAEEDVQDEDTRVEQIWDTDFLGNKRGRCRKCNSCKSFSMRAMKINPSGRGRG